MQKTSSFNFPVLLRIYDFRQRGMVFFLFSSKLAHHMRVGVGIFFKSHTKFTLPFIVGTLLSVMLTEYKLFIIVT